MEIRRFEMPDEAPVIALWERCGLTRAWNNPRKDIHRKLRVRPDMFLVGLLNGEIIGTVMAGYDGHRGWINYLAVAPQYQGQGLGRELMREVERRLCEEGCPKINLQIRVSNEGAIHFYRQLGYGVDEVVSMGKRLIRDEQESDSGVDGV